LQPLRSHLSLVFASAIVCHWFGKLHLGPFPPSHPSLGCLTAKKSKGTLVGGECTLTSGNCTLSVEFVPILTVNPPGNYATYRKLEIGNGVVWTLEVRQLFSARVPNSCALLGLLPIRNAHSQGSLFFIPNPANYPLSIIPECAVFRSRSAFASYLASNRIRWIGTLLRIGRYTAKWNSVCAMIRAQSPRPTGRTISTVSRQSGRYPILATMRGHLLQALSL